MQVVRLTKVVPMNLGHSAFVFFRSQVVITELAVRYVQA